MELTRGQQVRVIQPGLKPWLGKVLAIKPTKKGRFVDVQELDSPFTWVVPEQHVEEVKA